MQHEWAGPNSFKAAAQFANMMAEAGLVLSRTHHILPSYSRYEHIYASRMVHSGLNQSYQTTSGYPRRAAARAPAASTSACTRDVMLFRSLYVRSDKSARRSPNGRKEAKQTTMQKVIADYSSVIIL